MFIGNNWIESAKSRAWRAWWAHVLGVFACLCACILDVLACLRAWRACVLMCLPACVLRCLECLCASILGVLGVLTCLACLRAWCAWGCARLLWWNVLFSYVFAYLVRFFVLFGFHFNTLIQKNFFGLFFIRFVSANPCVISNKIPLSVQSSKQQRFNVLINIFSRSHVSYYQFVGMWHGTILHNRIFRCHLQEETFIISMFACWRQICFYSLWQFGNSSYWIM